MAFAAKNGQGTLEAFRIKQTIRYRGILVTLLDVKINPSDTNFAQFKAFKFDYERDIAGQPTLDSLDLEKDVTIYYFEAGVDPYLQEGSRILTPDNEAFTIQGRIHRQWLNNTLIYVNAPCSRTGYENQ